jgi:hypothetical protein
MENKVLKTKEADRYIGVSPWELRKLVHEGRLAYLSDGGTLYFCSEHTEAKRKWLRDSSAACRKGDALDPIPAL